MHTPSHARERFAFAPTLPFILAVLVSAPSPAAETETSPGTRCGYCDHGGTHLAEYQLEATGPAVLTIDPAGRGETLAQEGIRLRVRVGCNGTPAVGAPGEEIVLWAPELAGCSGIGLSAYLAAARPTDSEGWTEFVGTMRGGGCAERVLVSVDTAIWLEVPLRINSPDTGTSSPGAVDAGDLAALAGRLGQPALYSFCFDYNEDGAVDAGDVAYFVQSFGSGCR